MQSSETERPGFQVLDVADRAVRVMARRAGQLALAHRHVRHGTFGFRNLSAMAGRADFGLRLLDELMLERLRTVHAVAGDAREIAPIVGAAFPCGVGSPVMTGQADLIDLAGLDLFHLTDVSGCVIICVGLPGSVTDSHPCAAMGERGFFAWPWAVPFSDVSSSVWHVTHTSVPA